MIESIIDIKKEALSPTPIVYMLSLFVNILILPTISYIIKKKIDNIVTKKDLEEITRKVEKVKSDIGIDHIKNVTLLNEKIRTLKEINLLLSNCKKYCNARIGDLLCHDFTPTSESLDEEIYRSILLYKTSLENILEENLFFLSPKSREVIDETCTLLTNLCNFEIYEENFVDNYEEVMISSYEGAINFINESLESLYKDLNT